MIHLQWDSLAVDGEAFHIARHSRFRQTSPLHDHDFAEIFWVEDGRANHQVAGRFDSLSAGDLVLVHPDDVHCFRSPTPGFTITNLAFPAKVLGEMRSRYFPSLPFPWDSPSRTTPLRPARLSRIRELGASLALGPGTRLHLDRFLLEVFAVAEAPVPIESSLPPWLAEALEQWQHDPETMAAGVQGLARLAGRSREHVSRTVREATGSRAIDVLNHLRVENAASRLRMTDDPIAVIAIEVGLANLSHFYRMFRRELGTTPRRYRAQNRRTVDP